MVPERLPRVAFCGLGAMGGGMAKHLLNNEFEVTGFDIHAPFTQEIERAGGKAASSPAAASGQAEILLIMVTSSTQVTSVLFEENSGAIHSLPRSSVIIVSSTVPSEYYDEIRNRIDSEYNRPDVFLLDCPVSGGTPRAANGTLSIFSSGPGEGLKIAHPVLDCLSGTLYEIPGGIGFGSKAKMCHQVLPEVDIALCAEAFALSARAGLNTQKVFDAIQSSPGSSWIVGNRVPHMLEGDKTIYSAIINSQKDSSIIVNTSRLVHYPVFLVSTAEQVYQAAMNAGWTKDDDSSLPRLYLKGLPDDLIHQQTTPSIDPDDSAITIQDIIDIFIGVHLAVSAEALGFTEAIGLNTDVIYDIISKAAGSNVQFVEFVPHMKKPTWSLNDVESAKNTALRLKAALSKANSIGMPMPITSTALQLFHLHIGSL